MKKDELTKIIEETEKDELLREALNDGALAENEVAMLVNIKGISVCKTPRKDGRYCGYLTENGRKHFYYGRTRAEVARKIKRQLDNERNETPPKRTKNALTFNAYVDKWLITYKSTLKAKSIESIRYLMARPRQEFGEKPLASISPFAVQNLLLAIKGSRTRQMCYSYLSQVFRKAHKQGLIKIDPCETVELPKHEYVHKPALTSDEQAIIMNELNKTPYALLFNVLLSTGLRIGEALALTQADVKDGYISVNKNVVFLKGVRTVQNTPKTKAGNRVVPISDKLYEKIKNVQSDVIFPYAYENIKTVVRRAAARTSIAVSLHTFRHTYATRLEQAGISPKMKQYLLGHASLEMTQNVYTDTQFEQIKAQKDSIISPFDAEF